jgi:toxin ParE1/3/4
VRLRWTAPAAEQLQEIFLYIAPHDRAAAARTVRRIADAARDTLLASPHAGRPGRVAGTRELVVTGTPYIVAYAVREARIDILAVIHGARKWPAQFES